MYKLSRLGCIIRVSDGACIPPDPDNRDYRTYLAWVEAGNVATSEVNTSVVELIEKQWAKADSAIRLDIDDNARSRYVVWLINGNAAQKQMVADCIAWADSIWQSYYAAKTAILAGNLYAVVAINSACPHSFFDIANAT